MNDDERRTATSPLGEIELKRQVSGDISICLVATGPVGSSNQPASVTRMSSPAPDSFGIS